jgi:hypothetical protein
MGSWWGASWLLLSLLLQPLASDPKPPTIELAAARCVPPGARPRVCARVFDDGTIIRARAFFRASGRDSFYWTEMGFEGSRHCAWLPVPSRKTRAIDYYVEAVDDAYEASRSRESTLRIEATCPPVGEPPDDPPCVGTTRSGQAPRPPGFEAGSIGGGC